MRVRARLASIAAEGHVVDQALWLFGPVEQVFARLVEVSTSAGPTNASFVVVLAHSDGTISEVSASKLNHLQERELRVYGDLGSHLFRSTDVQAEAIFAGRRPVDDPGGWGHEPVSAWGTLRTTDGTRRSRGSYVHYYERFAEAVRTGGLPPVSAAEATATLAVLDAARLSAKTGNDVDLQRGRDGLRMVGRILVGLVHGHGLFLLGRG